MTREEDIGSLKARLLLKKAKAAEALREHTDLFAFIHVPDPTKVRVVKREQNDDKPWLLETTVGHTVLLLSVAPDRLDRELEASVDRIFDEGGSVHQSKQGDFARGGQDVNIQPIVEAADTIAKEAAPLQSQRLGKRKYVVVDAGGFPSSQKLREDHGTPSGIFVGSKSRSSLQKLLAGAVLNAEVGVMAIPTLPFVTAFVSTTPEREDEAHTDSMAEPNLRTIGDSQRFVISSDSSHHSGTHVAEAEVDSFVRSYIPVMKTITTVTSAVDLTAAAKENPFEPLLFGAGSSSAVEADPPLVASQILMAVTFLLVVSVLSSTPIVTFRRFTYLNGAEEEIESLKARLLLKEAKAAETIRLRVEASNFEAGEKSLRDEADALRECNPLLACTPFLILLYMILEHILCLYNEIKVRMVQL
nr:hypothetical protein [Tanacetum cinerariifolium]